MTREGASPYLTTEEAAEYLRFSVTAFREWARRRRHLLVPLRRGRVCLYDRHDLDKVIRIEARRWNREPISLEK